MWDQRAIRDRARECHGLIDRATALRLGASDQRIVDSMRAGVWEEVHPGVYYLNVTPRTWLTEVAAAVLAAGTGATASHRTAARMWGLDGITAKTIELTVGFTDDPMPHGVIVHRTRRPRPHHIRDAVPVTSVERTLLDLAAFLPDRVLEGVIESALRQRLTTVDLTAAILKADGGRGVTGTRRLRRCLGRIADELTGSFAESEFKQLLLDAPIPPPVFQMPLQLPNGDRAYADFAWPSERKLIELDGFLAHSTPKQLDRDLRRQNLILEMGWQLRRFTVCDVRNRPVEIVGEIIRFLTP